MGPSRSARGTAPVVRIRRAALVAVTCTLASLVVPVGPVSADTPIARSKTTQDGVELVLRLNGGPWRPDQRVGGVVRVTNTNDRRVWFLDRGCRDVSVEVRLPTTPSQGLTWTGDRKAFKQLALSARPEVGPEIGRFRVEGVGDCAEPVPEALQPGETRSYDVSWRVRHVGFGAGRFDVSAAFQLEGFRKADATWMDALPAPLTTSLSVAVDDRPAALLSPVRAIDRALGTTRIHQASVDSRRAGWIRVDMELHRRGRGDWEWRVGLWSQERASEDVARIAVSFVVDAKTGAVTDGMSH